ncbi:hypothetical protein [Actinophytocola oryzae]|uniref:Mce-associated membrane protein n=1 Tax=Actinophytocola oryzae TaxID=502181 RepID=A0A4R7UX03_9PSEU|nr:hypothetical protein [Actinophytocola oryzae]TDV41343.1 Mce-associated membrane protein [Actinophytocola oryzae]
MTGSELAESGDRDGSARLGESGTPEGGEHGESTGSTPVLESDEDLNEHDGIDGEYRGRPFWARTSTLVVFVVALLVLSGAVTAWLRISDLQDRLDTLEAQTLAAEEAKQAAIPLAEDLASYDYRDLGGNFRLVKASATPHFSGQLTQLTEELGPELQQTRAVATATVRSAGVVRASAREVVVAVFVDQTVTNTRSSTPRVEPSRMELTLVKRGDTWWLDQAGEL